MALDPQFQQLLDSASAPVPAGAPSLEDVIPAPEGAPSAAAPSQSASPQGSSGTQLDPQFQELLTNSNAAAASTHGAGAKGAPSDHPAPAGRLGPWASALARPVANAVAGTALAIPDALQGVTNAINAYRHGAPFSLNDLNPFARTDPRALPLPGQQLAQTLNRYTTAPTGALGSIGEGVNTLIAGAPFGDLLNGAFAPRGAPVPGGFSPGMSDKPPALLPAPAQGSSGMLTSAQREAAAGGRALGMRLPPGQASGSVPLQQLEAYLESHPATSGPFAAMKSANREILNRAAAQSIGENSNVVDAATLARADERLGGVFQNVRNANRTVAADPAATKGVLDQVDQDFDGLLPGDMSIRDNKLVGQLERLTSAGSITGKQLGQLSSKLGRAAFKAMTSPSGDRDLGQALYRVKDHVDDMVQSTLKPEEAWEYGQARQQYRNLMLLTSRTNIVNPSTGNISGAALASRLQQADRRGFLYGKNQTPLYQAARFAQAFKPIVGDSGTATRSGAGHGWALPIALGLGMGGGAHMMGSGGELEAALAAAPIAGRALANVGTRAYLTRPGAALARYALSTPRAARSAVALPWRALVPQGARAAPRRLRGLGPLGNPGLLALGQPGVAQP